MRFALLIFIVYFSLIILSNHHYVLADQIISAQPGGTFSSKSREPKYKIEFHPEDAPFSPDDDQESVIMPDKNGQKFLCYLPKVEKAKTGKPVIQLNTSSVIVESEERNTLKTPDELLEILQDRCLLRQEGWWTYEFCYKKKLRQLHVNDDDKVDQEFVLGVFDSEVTADFNQNQSGVFTVKDPRSKDASQKYHAHQYINGSICDLTSQPRETEVRFVCSESRAMITSITELSTCKYALTVQCPILCKHPLFQEEGPVWHVINCNALPKDYKETKVEGNSYAGKQSDMVNDIIYPTHYDSEYAT